MRILLLTYHFKPEQNAGADRPNSLYKYARENGVEMDVVTTLAPGAPYNDGSIRRFDAIAGWNRSGELFRKLPWKLLTKAIEPFAFNADLFWSNAVVRALQDKTSYNAIYVVFPKFSALVAGYRLSRKTQAPLIVDFTDAIMCDPLDPQNWFQRKVQLHFERKVVERCNAVITIAKGMEDDLRNRYTQKNILNVYNGFDPDDFEGIPLVPAQPPTGKQIRIVHFGNIGTSRKRDIGPLVHGLHMLSDQTEALASRMTIDFVGNYGEEERNQFGDLYKREIVRFLPYMNKRDGFRMISREYDCLLLYGTPGQPSTVTSKLLEYLRLGKPILGICKGNEAETIIRAAKAGECADFSAVSVCSLLKKALDRRVDFCPSAEYVERFSRKVQARTIFDFVRARVET